MIVVTTESLPGYEIIAVIGGVLGVAERTRNPYDEGIKSLSTGRRNPLVAVDLLRGREEAVKRMVEAARNKGANAVLGMRFDHRDISGYWAEVCAYGTAVLTRQLAPEPKNPAIGRASPVDGEHQLPAG